MIRTTLTTLTCLALATTTALAVRPSKAWTAFKSAIDLGSAPPIADFSYAGYDCGESPLPVVDGPIFDVTKFGAIANDGISDKAAIQKAIDEAAKAGGGVVFFPPGRFEINTDGLDRGKVIRVDHSNIVLRGSGAGTGGTELFMNHHLDAKDPSKMWTTPFIIQFNAPGAQNEKLANVVGTTQPNGHTIELDDTSKLKVGQRVTLKRVDKSPEAIRTAVAPFDLDPAWKDLTQGGVQALQHQEVVGIKGKWVKFREPIHYTIATNSGWSLLSINPLEECGIEDIAFVGNWKEKFVHHKSAVHDGGWSILSLNRLANSWITRCRFTDVNNCMFIKGSTHVTASQLTLDGNRGHGAVGIQYSSHCLGARIVDTASHWHACGVSKQSTGNVYWRIEYPADTSFEAHAQQPRHTLFDNVKGGFIDGRWGGSHGNQPNHMEGLVFWNYHNLTNDNPTPYEFMKTKSKWGRIVMPHVIGFHGGEVNFVPSQVKTLESLGTPVEPESLYEAQLTLRLSKLPKWLLEMK